MRCAMETRECNDHGHVGERSLPESEFPRNGRYRRTVCKACWARQHRERYAAANDDEAAVPAAFSLRR